MGVSVGKTEGWCEDLQKNTGVMETGWTLVVGAVGQIPALEQAVLSAESYCHGQHSEQGGAAEVTALLSLTRHKFAAPAEDPLAFLAEIHLGPEQFNKPSLLEGA